MAKRKKITKHSTPLVEGAKNRTDWEEYYNTIAFQMAPANDEVRKRLAITLVEWSRKLTQALDIDDFCDDAGVNPSTYYEWIKKSPELKEAHEYAKRRLASIRLRKSQEGEWNWAACRWALPFYGEKYLEHEKTLESVKAKAETQGGANVIRIVEVPVWREKDGSIVEVEMNAQ